MPNSPNSSTASASAEAASCRIEWRPSAIACGALIALGLLAGLSTLVSDLPRACAWPAALLAPAWGAWLARREGRRQAVRLFWRADGGLFVDGERARCATVQWRGPIAFLAWDAADGRRRRLALWPDTLPAARRRELRLAAAASEAAHPRARMAP
jgi:toxin CptA